MQSHSLRVTQRSSCVKGFLAPDPSQAGEDNVVSGLGHVSAIHLLELLWVQLEGSVHLPHCKIK